VVSSARFRSPVVVPTGFYFGGTDTFAYVAAVDTLIRARYTTAIAHGYDLYPVFHFLVGTVRHATGCRPTTHSF